MKRHFIHTAITATVLVLIARATPAVEPPPADVTRSVTVSTTIVPEAIGFNEGDGLNWSAPDQTKSLRIILNTPDEREIICDAPQFGEDIAWNCIDPPGSGYNKWAASHTYQTDEIPPDRYFQVLFSGDIRAATAAGGGATPKWHHGVIQADIQVDADNDSTASQRPPATDATERNQEEVAEQGGDGNPAGLIVSLNRLFDEGTATTTDFEKAGTVANDPHLVQGVVVLKIPEAVLPDSKIKIEYNSSRLAVYKSGSLTTPIASGSQMTVSTFGTNTTILIEGLAASPSSGGDQIQVTLTPKNGDVSKDKTVLTIADANMTALKYDSSELGNNAKDSPGAYVAVNNDNDNYAFSGAAEVIDKTKTDAITDENDLVPLKLHTIAPSNLGGKYKLVFTSDKIKLWKNANHSEAITSDSTEFDATSDTTVYVEGLTLSTAVAAEVITLKWVSGTRTCTVNDRNKFTVYQVTGPRYVPGYAVYTYKGEIPGTGVGSWDAEGGTLGGTGNECTIHWGEGPAVGKAKFSPSTGFTCEREVYVVQVKLKDDDTNSITYGNPPVQDTDIPKLIRSVVFGGGVPAMSAKLVVDTIDGPNVNGTHRGMRFIQMGFVQNGQFNQLHADFNNFTPPTLNQRVKSSIEGTAWHVDSFLTSAFPWVDSVNTYSKCAYYAPTMETAAISNTSFDSNDRPRLRPTNTLTVTVGEETKDVSSYAIEFNLRLYFAVRTTDTANSANTVYTQRAAADWHFNGSGTLNAAHVWTAGAGAGNGTAVKFNIVSSGDVVPVTDGDPCRTLLNNQTWSTQNQ